MDTAGKRNRDHSPSRPRSGPAGPAHQHLHAHRHQRRFRQPGPARAMEPRAQKKAATSRAATPGRLALAALRRAAPGRRGRRSQAERPRPPGPWAVCWPRSNKPQQDHPQGTVAMSRRRCWRTPSAQPRNTRRCAQQQQGADGAASSQCSLRGGPPRAGCSNKVDRPGDEEARSGHQEGRDGLHGHAHAQVGSAPEEVHRHQAPEAEQTLVHERSPVQHRGTAAALRPGSCAII